MSKTSYDYFLEQKHQQELYQFRQQIIDEINLNLQAFKIQLMEELRQELKQHIYQQQGQQKVELKIDAAEAAKQLQKALRF